MPSKEFTFGFVLSAAMNSSFASSFAKASREVDELRKYMDKLGEETQQLQKAFGAGIINEKTFNTAVMQKNQKSLLAWKNASMDMFRSAFADWNIMYYNVQAFAGAFGKPMQAAIQFESTMADVRKVVDFDTPEQFQQMSRDVLELSKNIPMTADGLGQIVAAGGQSGIAREELVSFAEEAAKMGVAFDITADQAGTMMAQWRTAFKMGQADVVALADKINYLGNTTAASAPQISDVITRVGPLGEVGGVASGEIAALGASLVGAGINSDVAATGIKNLILAMASGESATKTQQEALASLGIDTVELAQRMQTDAKGAILDVLQSISQLDAASQASTLQNIFGKESLGAIAPLLSNLDGLRANFDKVADAAQYTGSMEQEFDTRSKTTANSIQLMNNRLDAAEIAIGQGLLPLITPAAEAVGTLASAIGNVAMSSPGAIKGIATFIGIVGGVTIAVRTWKIVQEEFNAVRMLYNSLMTSGTLKTYAALAASKLAAASTRTWAAAQWVWNAALSANPIGLLIVGIAGLVTAGIWLYNNWDTVKNFFVTLWNDPERALSDFGAGVKSTFLSLYEWVIEKWTALKEFVSHPIDTAVNFVSGGAGVASNAAGGIYRKGAFLTTFAEDGPEAAIPLTPSRRSVGLWTEAGQALGTIPGPDVLRRGITAPRSASSGGAVTVDFRPQVTIQGNADAAVVQQAMTVTVQQIRRMLEDIAHNGRRLSYE